MICKITSLPLTHSAGLPVRLNLIAAGTLNHALPVAIPAAISEMCIRDRLCVDDDMRMEALRQTNYVTSIVTAQGKMDLERKGMQSYQGWMFARLLAFSNVDLQALYDRSNGFYRRQLVLTTKEKPMDRADEPDLAEKMKAEAEGIFLWAFVGNKPL